MSTPPLVSPRAPRIWDLFDQPAIKVWVLCQRVNFNQGKEVPPREIEEAIRRKRKFELDPERHTYKES